MAKELPYFKFFVSEWTDGDITLEDLEAQGLFVNICSYYWSNECNVSFIKLCKKFRNNKELIDILIESGVIKLDDKKNIIISFLLEQLAERNKLSNKNSENARKRWEEKPVVKPDTSDRNATALDSQSQSDAIKRREEKRREEKRKNNIDEIYKLYPGKCPIKGNGTGKSFKDKEKIKNMLSNISKEHLIKTITLYISDCKKSKTYMKNFSTFLNKLPDYNEEIEAKPKIELSYEAEYGLTNELKDKVYSGEITEQAALKLLTNGN